MESSNLATIAKFDEIVKIGGCTLLITANVLKNEYLTATTVLIDNTLHKPLYRASKAPQCTQRAHDTIITSSLRQNDVVLT